MRAPALVATAAVICLSAQLAAAEPALAVDATAADQVALRFHGLPVVVALARIAAPDGDAAKTCQDRLSVLVKGKPVTLIYDDDFGAAAGGPPRVEILIGHANVNAMLLSEGLAKYLPGGKTVAGVDAALQAAEGKAKKAGTGVWAGAADAGATADAPAANAPVTMDAGAKDSATPAPAPAAAPAATADAGADAAPAPTGPFCSELNTSTYYASDDPAVASINPQRLIFYPDEASAQKAGKTRPVATDNTVAADNTVAGADALYAQGKDLCQQAFAAGNTPKRDDLYAQAYVVLSKAMQIYSPLVDKDPNNDEFGNKLHDCMQMRYGTVKMRRFAD